MTSTQPGQAVVRAGTPLSARALSTPEPLVRAFSRRVQQEGALDLTQGDYKNADFAPHPEVIRAAQRITRNTVHSYGPAVGRMDVRSEIAEFFNRDGRIDYPSTDVRFLPDEVLFTPGTRSGRSTPSGARRQLGGRPRPWRTGRAHAPVRHALSALRRRGRRQLGRDQGAPGPGHARKRAHPRHEQRRVLRDLRRSARPALDGPADAGRRRRRGAAAAGAGADDRGEARVRGPADRGLAAHAWRRALPRAQARMVRPARTRQGRPDAARDRAVDRAREAARQPRGVANPLPGRRGTSAGRRRRRSFRAK